MQKIVIAKLVSMVRTGHARLVFACFAVAAMASMAFASVAGATEPIIEPAVKKTTEEFSTNLPVVLTLVGLLVAIALVVSFFKRHAKKA
jgi:quinol-cytochrome oxidoreductase complex cytochrome b subunit